MNGELIYELERGFHVPAQLILWFVLCAPIAAGLVFIPRMRTIWPFSIFTFGIKGRWAGYVPALMIVLIGSVHLAMENVWRFEIGRRVLASESEITTGCLERFEEIPIVSRIMAVIIDGRSFSGVGFYGDMDAMSAIRRRFEIGDPIRIEHVEEEIVRIWTVADRGQCSGDIE